MAAEPKVRLRYVRAAAELGHPDVVILPGTKSTMEDLAWIEANGLGSAIRTLAEHGTTLVGICGGYQMLGQRITDPNGIESKRGEIAGLDLLPVETIFEREKATYQVKARLLRGPGWLHPIAGCSLQGYEIHMGRTVGNEPWLEIFGARQRADRFPL